MRVQEAETREVFSQNWVKGEKQAGNLKKQVETINIRGQERGLWKRTIFVPEGIQPIDIVEAYPFDLPFPMFCAGIPKLKKRRVEYIASAMADLELRWEKMCSFSVARYQKAPTGTPEISIGGLCFEPEAYVGERVLVEGHHCFLAFLLCGLPPSDLQPIRINNLRDRVERLYPWWMVSWTS
jgi:hypothetical protein